MKYIPFIIIIAFLSRCKPIEAQTTKINGLNLVGPPKIFSSSYFRPINEVGANFVAIIPFAFSQPNEPAVTYGQNWQWWGEQPGGITTMIQHARAYNLQVMLKPHVWVSGQGWPGDFKLENESDWQIWEKQYEKYILDYARLADSLKVEIFCIGTEYRIAVKDRPQYWRGLINKVSNIYSGKITYAANWDNYENVVFWEALDFIGINAYWALSDNKTPTTEELVESWQPIKKQMKSLSMQNKKPIIFTEFGYQSVDYTARGHWNLDLKSLNMNMKGQANAYQAIFEVFWQEQWCAGGFLWKWFPKHEKAGGSTDKRFTPQRKLAEEVIKDIYSENN